MARIELWSLAARNRPSVAAYGEMWQRLTAMNRSGVIDGLYGRGQRSHHDCVHSGLRVAVESMIMNAKHDGNLPPRRVGGINLLDSHNIRNIALSHTRLNRSHIFVCTIG